MNIRLEEKKDWRDLNNPKITVRWRTLPARPSGTFISPDVWSIMCSTVIGAIRISFLNWTM